MAGARPVGARVKTWEDWENVHQPYELDHWTERGGIEWAASDAFLPWWRTIHDFIGAEGRCLDVGCGPRPPFGRGSTAIDPLIDRYQKLVPPEWWKGVEVFPVPAERFITELAGRFDTVMCWNCIDHTIGWQQILTNLAAYGAKDATYAIATDFNPPGPGHPGFDRKEFFAELRKHFRIVKRRRNFQDRAVALVLCAR